MSAFGFFAIPEIVLRRCLIEDHSLSFSKKWENLEAAYSLWFAYYNWCRVHSSLRVTPCMEARIENHIWTIAELIA